MLRRPPPSPLFPYTTLFRSICRSPFAAALLAADLAGVGVRVESAGFMGPNRRCPPAAVTVAARRGVRSEEHTSELQSQFHLVCRLLLEKKKTRQLCTYTRVN